MSSSNCCFLTCIQISQVVWYPHLFQNFPQFIVLHTIKGFGVVNKAEVDVFLELSCFFYDPMSVGNLISGSSAFSKASLNIWKFTVHVLLKPGLENFEHVSGQKEVETLSPWLMASVFLICVLSCSVVSNSLPPHGLLPARLLCPWDSPGKNTKADCHFLLHIS